MTLVDQPITWSPEKRTRSSRSAKQTWFEVWPGGVHALEGPAVARDDVAAPHLDLGDELHVSPLLRLHPVLPRAVRAVAVDGARPHLRLERAGGRRVVVVGVGDEDVAHLLTGDRGGKGPRRGPGGPAPDR